MADAHPILVDEKSDELSLSLVFCIIRDPVPCLIFNAGSREPYFCIVLMDPFSILYFQIIPDEPKKPAAAAKGKKGKQAAKGKGKGGKK